MLKKIPSCFFGKGFGCTVAMGGGLGGFLFGDGVPVFFAVGVTGAGAFAAIDYGGE